METKYSNKARSMLYRQRRKRLGINVVIFNIHQRIHYTIITRLYYSIII